MATEADVKEQFKSIGAGWTKTTGLDAASLAAQLTDTERIVGLVFGKYQGKTLKCLVTTERLILIEVSTPPHYTIWQFSDIADVTYKALFANGLISFTAGSRRIEIEVIGKDDGALLHDFLVRHATGEHTGEILEEEIRCPKCQSTQFSTDKKGFGLGKAAIGGVLLGPVGLLGGFVGSGNVKITCLKCGNTWKPGH